ncbi:alpha/beta fold hydrolase [Streptomyces sp. NPDC003703]|uniref:alpha/beta fold hydrolase n=1 Tax=Streptomyces sp. NPDC003283 TaxID=3364681 RepID=UPI0036AF3248
MPDVTTGDGVRINVVEKGRADGPPIVFVHGLGSSSQAWEGVMAASVLADRYRLIAFDLRGHGRSDTALKPEQLTADGPAAGAELWSRDLDAVLAGLVSPAPILVGWSFGAGVIQSWLHTHGGLGQAAAAVLACAPNVIGPVPPEDPAAELITWEAIQALAGAAHDGTAFARRILANGPDDTSADAGEVARVAAVAEATPAESVAAVLHHVIDFRPFLSTLDAAARARITAVIADGDQIFDQAAGQAVWKQAGIRTVHVPDAGHALPIREPDRFARLLLDVLEAHDD